MDDLLRAVFDATPVATDSLATWWAGTEAVRARWPVTVDQALVAGAHADRLGFAFAGGYSAALRALVGETGGMAALCATESGGNAPRAITTTLAGGKLDGIKTWATGAPLATTLFVVASVGEDRGQNRLRVVRVAADAPGVTLQPAHAPFVPEIPHAKVTLDRVAVRDADILPGDGYTDYLKPFRTIEDIHVHAALLGYMIGVARRHPTPSQLVELLVAIVPAIRELGGSDPKSAMTHLALGGMLRHVVQLLCMLEVTWDVAGGEEWTRWQRDKPLLQVASGARKARLDKAWATLGNLFAPQA